MAIFAELKDAFKTCTPDQDKTIIPEETVKRFIARCRQTGLDIFGHTERIDTGRLDIPVYISRYGKDAQKLTGTGKQMGKGGTPAQAEASAVMELAERFSFYAFANDPEHFNLVSAKKLDHPWMGFDMIAESVNDDSRSLSISRSFFETLPLKWCRGYNLSKKQEVMIPFDWFFAINEFNGTSAGNCMEEAVLQGICEVVERHVCAGICREMKPMPAIRTESMQDQMGTEILEKYKKAGIAVHLLDYTLDTGIPTIGIIAYDPETFPEKSEIVWTAGTATNPEKAALRALTETAQLGGDFHTGSNYVASGLPKLTSPEAIPSLISDETRAIQELFDLSHPNILVEVKTVLQELSKRQMQVFGVDTTHPKLGIPSCYMLIPGAWFRERAEISSVAMFTAKLITEKFPPHVAFARLSEMDAKLPDTYYIRFYMGRMQMEMGNDSLAISLLNTALSLDPLPQDAASVCSYLAMVHKDRGEYETALAILEKGEEFDCDRTDIHNMKGFCYYRMKEHEKAISCFEKVLSIDPSSAIDYANIGTNYRELKAYEQAILYYQMALNLDPDIQFAKENLEKLLSGVK